MQIDFAGFEAKYFDELNNTTWRVIKYYCYIHRFRIDHNFGPSKTCTTVILKAIIVKWHNK